MANIRPELDAIKDQEDAARARADAEPFPAKPTDVTDDERALLRAILDSEYQDGSDPVGLDVWSRPVCGQFGDTADDIMDSLVEQGLAHSCGPTMGHDSTCRITRAGLDALSS